MIDLSRFVGFQWDQGNRLKNWARHQVTAEESEQVFFNQPLLLFASSGRSPTEKRYYVLGRTDAGRRLFVVLTARNNLIRVISARDMGRRERRRYDEGESKEQL